MGAGAWQRSSRGRWPPASSVPSSSVFDRGCVEAFVSTLDSDSHGLRAGEMRPEVRRREAVVRGGIDEDHVDIAAARDLEAADVRQAAGVDLDDDTGDLGGFAAARARAAP